MKKISLKFTGLLIFISVLYASCGSSKQNVHLLEDEKIAFEQTKGDTISLANSKIEYEVMIIEPGFNFWLRGIAKPAGYYSQSFLENRNRIYVMNWNQRALLPTQYDPKLYEQPINYDANIDYGYDVNYKLYNYFIYFQRKYNQRLGPWSPQI